MPKYGCPSGFDKLSEYMCVHMRRDSKGVANPNTFADAMEYCGSIESSSTLLHFQNPTEASKVWNWLG